MTIGPFKDDYRWLSNFFEVPVVISGRTYPTTEHFYQASKCANPADYAMIEALETPGKTKRAGAKVEVRKDWDNVKESVMAVASFSKFTQNKELGEKLLSTGDEEIVEINTWCDNYWGQCICEECYGVVGKNVLGEILMDVRSYLTIL
jgi:ribA/ribD-fused uncharacterized protein